jgi:hypothetical protein
MRLAWLPRHRAVAYLRLVRSMLIARTLLMPALFALASCASTPVIYSDSTTVSHADIDTAVEIVQQRCVREGRGLLPVFRVDVDRLDRIFVHCGPHYGVADAAGALTFFVERRRGTWQITGMSQYTRNPERVIVT